jgi:sugar lactone lactonase YvrE
MSRKIPAIHAPFVLTAAVSLLLGCSPSSSGPSPGGAGPSPGATAGAPSADSEAEQAAGDAGAAAPLKKAELLVVLPGDYCNTPDGMCLLPDGNVLLSMPNFNDTSQPPCLVKITPDNQVEKFLDLPPHPETGEPFGPLGICLAPSGDLFVADYQMTGDRKSRVMRIVMKDGVPQEIVPAVVGFRVSNAVIVRDGHLYVTETQIDPEARPATSGVFRFKLEDLDNGVIELATPVTDDPQLIATIETHDEELPLGADGLAFDKQGNLYVGNFADGTVHKLAFDAEGKVASNEIFAKADFMKCADGLFFDPETEVIYVADSRANAVQMVSLDGSVATLAQNADTDGLDGGMDQPCEVLLRGRELIVSNMDWPVPGCINQKYDEPCTLSVIRLDD